MYLVINLVYEIIIVSVVPKSYSENIEFLTQKSSYRLI